MATRNFTTGGPKAVSGSASATGNSINAGEREDLANFISMISRDETPFLSSIGKTKATAILHEWQTDELATPAVSAVAEGVSFSTVAAAQAAEPMRTRLANYTQINSKVVQVTGTKRAVDQAGVADEYAYQLKKRGIEMKRDQEFSLVHSWQSSNGAGTRTFGGYQAWMNHNVVNALTTANEYTAPTNLGVGVTGTFTTVTSADKNPLQLSHVDTLMQTIYEAGGKATKLMVSPANRRAFSARSQAAGSQVFGTNTAAISSNTTRSLDDGKLRQSVEIYMSDFGDVMVVPNYIMGLSKTDISGLDEAANFCALVYDPMWFAVAVLRPMQEVELGQLGDSIIGQIVEEITLECKNPKGAGLILGLSGA